MAIFIIILCIIIALVILYAMKGRQWLKSKTWAQPFFDWIEPVEILLYKKSETILMGRLLWIGSGMVTIYDSVATFASGLDLTPITTRIFDALHVAQDLRGIVASGIIAGIGLLMNWLRVRVTKPIELVAAPEVNATPEVKVAMAQADEAKDQAVATVKAAA